MNGFILIDRLVELHPGARVVATKTFAADDEIFRDHFPGNPLVPGSLLIEAMAQAAGWLVVATTSFEKSAQLVMVRDAKFRKGVRPATALALSATIDSSRGGTYEVKAEARASGDVAASAHLVLQTFDLEPDARDAALASWARETFRAIGGETLRLGH